MTYILLPIGLSEIPVLVAAYRLCCRFHERDGTLPTFSPLCFPDTVDEAERVRLQLLNKLRGDKLLVQSARLIWDPEIVSTSKPDTILERVTKIAKKTTAARTLHVHCTRDSRSLDIHAVSALLSLAARENGFESEISYFASEDNVLRDGKGVILGDGQDERLNWNLSISNLARLNNFTPEFFSRRERRFFRITEPDPELLAIGSQMTAVLRVAEHQQSYAGWLREVWEPCWKTDVDGKWRDWNRWPQPPPRSRWPRKPVLWPLLKGDGAWAALTIAMKRLFGGESVWTADNDRVSLQLANLTEDQLSCLNQLLHHQCLELFAYHSLRLALNRLGFARFPVYHSLHFARVSNAAPYRDFEVDVVSVLGYQLLAVSCSMSSDQFMLKKKAFEVLHRARQIGGDSARTILLCTLPPHDACELFADVQEDTGPSEDTLQVWGVDALGGLVERFESYLQDTLRLKPPLFSEYDNTASPATEAHQIAGAGITYLSDSIMRRIRVGEFPNEEQARALCRQSLMCSLSALIEPHDVALLLDFIDTESGARAGFVCGLLRNYSKLSNVNDRLLQKWETARDPELRASLLWRILDIPELPIERHQEIFDFIQEHSDVCRQHELVYFESSAEEILRHLKNRYTAPEVPLAKKWTYLCIAGTSFKDKIGAKHLVEMGLKSDRDFTRHVAAMLLQSWSRLPDSSRREP